MGKKRLSPHFTVKNNRRAELIEKEFISELTTDEEQELVRLTDWVDGEITRVHPVDFSALGKLEAQVAAIEARKKLEGDG